MNRPVPDRRHYSPTTLVRALATCVAALAAVSDDSVWGDAPSLQRLPPVDVRQAAPSTTLLPSFTVAPPDLSSIHPVQYYSAQDSDYDSAFSPPKEPSSVAAVVPLHRSRTADAKDGVLQRAAMEADWLAPSGSGGIGLTEYSTDITLGAPLAGGAVLLGPYYTLSLFDGPNSIDIPGNLHGLGVNIKYFRQFTEGVGAAVWVVPGLYTDFQAENSDAFRLGGGAVATLQRTATAKWILGVTYLGRKDIGILPAVGLIWTPSDIVRFDLVFPRPEAKWMVLDCAGIEWWAFVAGQLGGNSWAYQRTDGTSDIMSYRDFRITLGIERRGLYNIKSRFEVGYVFGRVIETVTPSRQIDLNDTVMLRGGLVY